MIPRIPKSVAIPLVVGVFVIAYQGPGHGWARGSLGDVAAVAFIVGVFGWKTTWSLPGRLLIVGALASAVECAQLLPGAADQRWWVVLVVGSHFDPWDFAYYALGLAAGAALEHRLRPGSMALV